MQENTELSRVFKALSHPNRLKIFLNILNREGKDRELDAYLSELTDNFSIGAPTISHHLKELVNAGLVKTDKRGKYVTCQINEDMVEKLKTVFKRENRKAK
jgi:DNA-binding transcriptional ArsR family regulator